jgi:urease accessory protein
LITADSVIGNITKDDKLGDEYNMLCQRGLCEKIVISRLESQRVRMRKTTNKGTDVGLTLAPGTVLRNGDIIYLTKEKMIVVEIEPENVAILSLRSVVDDHELFATAVRIGHALGNLHRPMKIDGVKIYVPIQADTEIELLHKIFENVRVHLEIARTKIVFEAEEGMPTHEHT